MARWNGLVDSPPPALVAARASQRLADAIDAFHRSRGEDRNALMRSACSKEVQDDLAASIDRRTAKLVALLGEAEDELRELVVDRALATWVGNPVENFVQRSPIVASKSNRVRRSVTAWEMLDELRGVAQSPTLTYSREMQRDGGLRPFGPIPDYRTVAPGYEGPDTSGRVRGAA